jgi:glycosyltransferase involved in cell wall biosynthesis
MSNLLGRGRSLPEIELINMGTTGGAAQVAKRLNNNLKNLGVKSNLRFLNESASFGSKMLYRVGSKIDFEIQKTQPFITTNTFWSGVGGSQLLLNEINKIPKDKILHFHWVPGIFSHELLEGLIDRKLVITLHDMRYMTGYCHHSGACNGFKGSCKDCPQAPAILHSKIANSFLEYSTRLEQIKQIRLIAPSEWILDLAEVARPARNLQIFQIYNPIPEDIFNIDLRETKESISNILKICLYGSANISKGGREALSIIKRISHQLNFTIEVYVLGRKHLGFEELIQIEVEEIDNEIEFASFLCKMDVLMHLSLAENSPNIIREAQAAGVAVVASNVGGTSELILNDSTGLVLPKSDSDIVEFFVTINSKSVVKERFKVPKNRPELTSEFIMSQHLKVYESFT